MPEFFERQVETTETGEQINEKKRSIHSGVPLENEFAYFTLDRTLNKAQTGQCAAHTMKSYQLHLSQINTQLRKPLKSLGNSR